MSSTSTIGALGKVINTAVAIVIWLFPVLSPFVLKFKTLLQSFTSSLEDVYSLSQNGLCIAESAMIFRYCYILN